MAVGYALTGFHSAGEYWRCLKSLFSILRHRVFLSKTAQELAEAKISEGGHEMKQVLVSRLVVACALVRSQRRTAAAASDDGGAAHAASFPS